MSKTTKEIIEELDYLKQRVRSAKDCGTATDVIREIKQRNSFLNRRWFSEERRLLEEREAIEEVIKHWMKQMPDTPQISFIGYDLEKELGLEKEEKMSETISFDEQFPSLKDTKFVILWNSGEWTNGNFSRIDDTAVKCAMIKQCCLDKAKVREAIEMIRANSGNVDVEMEHLCNKLGVGRK